MRSRVSFFNRGVCKNLLRRFWPLWAGYFALLLFLLPVSLAKTVAYAGETRALSLQRDILESGVAMIWISFGMGILTAMVVFGYLYNTRVCGLMNSLPIRRETLFLTAWLTGLLPMLAAELLTALITGALYRNQGLQWGDLLRWLLMAVCSNLIFYGLAVFCAMLTGSLLMLPVAYVALNLAACEAEACLRTVLRALVYGISTQNGNWLTGLSPLVFLDCNVRIQRIDGGERWVVLGLNWLLLYAAVGLALSALALLLYRRRSMERATDTVAFPVLKPIFRYCMAVGGALVFATAVHSLLLGGSLHGRTAALLILALLLLGAALGWYVAEMLIRRTVRVFPGKWKGLAVVCAILCLLTLTAEFDLTGFERRVPDPDRVEAVTVRLPEGWSLREPENIRRAVELHQNLVDHKTLHEPEIHQYGDWILLHYELKDGGSMERAYYLQCYESPDPADLDDWEELINCPELLDQRDLLRLPVTEKTVYAAQLSYRSLDAQGRDIYQVWNMTQEEALDFYYHAVLPDKTAHTLGRIWLRVDGRRLYTVSNVSFHLDLMQMDPTKSLPDSAEYYDYLDTEIGMDSEACVAWIRAHTEIPIHTLRESMSPTA